jgi:4-amino-4-deoxy-L-arabinose transferase-like glycosyltransferase
MSIFFIWISVHWGKRMLFLSTKDHSQGQTTIKLARRASWYKNWEFYPIILFATFLRFYKVNMSEFDFDQALIYRLAYDAVHHGLWPVTNSTASLGFANAPGELYLLMLPAAFSANPLYGSYVVSLLASISVLITYIFTTRYYGRLAGAIATLLYATAVIPLYYERFLWQPNMMYPFVILFMFTLFIGVVEQRKGWFGPALILLGILYQTHGITLTLAVPLVLACCMAFKTIRWRDLLYGISGLAIIFFPFMLWQLVTHFSDIPLIIAQNTKPAVLNGDSWTFYRLLISPYDNTNPPINPHSLARLLLPLTSSLYNVMCYLVIAGGLLAVLGIFVPWIQHYRSLKHTSIDQINHKPSFPLLHVMRALPLDARGLLLLCAWQIVPIVALIKHASNIYPQYMLVVLPGPFILMSYILVATGKHVQFIHIPPRFWLRILVGILLTAVIMLELVNSVATLRDQTDGYVNTPPYYNTLYSLQKVLADAQHLAQQRHLQRIFIGVDLPRGEMLLYLSEHTHYPVSVFFANQCLLLPSATDGPAILIMPPYLPAATRIAKAHGAHLLAQEAFMNHSPFSFYELPATPKSLPPATQQNTFAQNLQAVSAGYQNRAKTSLFTSWSLLRSYPLSDSTTYSYHFTARAPGQQLMESACTFNMTHAGDELQPAFAIPAKQAIPTTLSLSAQYYATTPDRPVLGPFHLETHRLFDSQPAVLRTVAGSDAIIVNLKGSHV